MAQEGAGSWSPTSPSTAAKAVADKLGRRPFREVSDVTSEDNWKPRSPRPSTSTAPCTSLLNSAGIRARQDGPRTSPSRNGGACTPSISTASSRLQARRPRDQEAYPSAGRLGDQHLVDLASSPGQHGGLQLGQGRRAACSASRWRCTAPSRATTSAATRCIRPSSTRRSRPLPRPLRQRGDAAEARPPVPISRLGWPEEVGWALVFLASDESSFMTGLGGRHRRRHLGKCDHDFRR